MFTFLTWLSGAALLLLQLITISHLAFTYGTLEQEGVGFLAYSYTLVVQFAIICINSGLIALESLNEYTVEKPEVVVTSKKSKSKKSKAKVENKNNIFKGKGVAVLLWVFLIIFSLIDLYGNIYYAMSIYSQKMTVLDKFTYADFQAIDAFNSIKIYFLYGTITLLIPCLTVLTTIFFKAAKKEKEMNKDKTDKADDTQIESEPEKLQLLQENSVIETTTLDEPVSDKMSIKEIAQTITTTENKEQVTIEMPTTEITDESIQKTNQSFRRVEEPKVFQETVQPTNQPLRQPSDLSYKKPVIGDTGSFIKPQVVTYKTENELQEEKTPIKRKRAEDSGIDLYGLKENTPSIPLK